MRRHAPGALACGERREHPPSGAHGRRHMYSFVYTCDARTRTVLHDLYCTMYLLLLFEYTSEIFFTSIVIAFMIDSRATKPNIVFLCEGDFSLMDFFCIASFSKFNLVTNRGEIVWSAPAGYHVTVGPGH